MKEPTKSETFKVITPGQFKICYNIYFSDFCLLSSDVIYLANNLNPANDHKPFIYHVLIASTTDLKT